MKLYILLHSSFIADQRRKRKADRQRELRKIRREGEKGKRAKEESEDAVKDRDENQHSPKAQGIMANLGIIFGFA